MLIRTSFASAPSLGADVDAKEMLIVHDEIAQSMRDVRRVQHIGASARPCERAKS
jgi:hypothetical protein